MGRYLFVNWEGGGNTPPLVAIARRLIDRGHDVRVLSDACNEEEFSNIGARFVRWKRNYCRLDKTPESDLMRDWETSSPIALFKRACDRLMFGPAFAQAQDVIEELEHD